MHKHVASAARGPVRSVCYGEGGAPALLGPLFCIPSLLLHASGALVACTQLWRSALTGMEVRVSSGTEMHLDGGE